MTGTTCPEGISENSREHHQETPSLENVAADSSVKTQTTADSRNHAHACKAVSRREAAICLDVCVSTIDNMAKRGELRVVRYASRVKVPVSELHRLLGEGETTPSPPALSYQQSQEADAQE